MKTKMMELGILQQIRREWEHPCFDAVPEGKRKTFENRVKAVDMYLDGIANDVIEQTTGIEKTHIYKYVNYCLALKEDGTYAGYEALIPYMRKPKSSSATVGTDVKGPFAELLHTYPGLEEFIVGNFTGDEKYTKEKVMSFSSLHRKFLLECRDLGLGEDDYPFNSTSMAEMSLRRYLARISDKDASLNSNRIDENARQIQSSTGHGMQYTRRPVMPYAAVQIDGHVIDMIYTTEITLEDGTTELRECTRCWIIAVIDVSTRCILGYSLSQEFNYNQYDVLKAIRDSLTVHDPKDFTDRSEKGTGYAPFPSNVYKELENAIYDTVMLDNAKSHLAINVVDKLCNDLKCCMHFGSVSTPETRSIIERFFGTLESRGFHRLPCTTGSHGRDVKRSNPEKAAVKYAVSFDEITRLVARLVAEYNNTPHSSLFNRTPIEEMGRKIEHGMLPCIATEKEMQSVSDLLMMTTVVTVRGNKNEGRRPYVRFLGATYRNDVLTSDYSFVGQKLTLSYDPDDISSVKAYLPSGKSLGTLTAVGEYGKVAHSVHARREMNRYAKENKNDTGILSTPVTDYEKHLDEMARKSRRARTKADILRREISRAVPDAAELPRDMTGDPDRNEHIGGNVSAETIMALSSEELWEEIRRKKNGAR